MKEYTDADIVIQIPNGEEILKSVNKVVISVRDKKGNVLNRQADIDEDLISIHLSPIDFDILKPGIIEIEASLFDNEGLVSKTETIKDKINPSVAGEILDEHNIKV